MLQDIDVFQETIDIFYQQFKDKEIETVVGIESRGFIFAAPLALKLGCRFVLARKPGKLPGETIAEEYELEYGTDSIEMHKTTMGDPMGAQHRAPGQGGRRTGTKYNAQG